MSKQFTGCEIQEGFDVSTLFEAVEEAVRAAKNKLASIKSKKDQFSINDMFEMQMMINNLSQLSELSTSVVSATHHAILSMTRNIKT